MCIRDREDFAAFLQARVDAGELEIPDVARATEQFFTLLKGELHARMLCGLCARPQRVDVAAHLDACVDLFLRAYAVR